MFSVFLNCLMISATKLGKLEACLRCLAPRQGLPWQKAKDLAAWLSLAAICSRRMCLTKCIFNGSAKVHKCPLLIFLYNQEQSRLVGNWKCFWWLLMKASCKSRSKTLACRDSTRFRHSKSPGYVAYIAYEWIVHHTRGCRGQEVAMVSLWLLCIFSLWRLWRKGSLGSGPSMVKHGRAWAWVSACRPASTWTKAVANTNKEKAKYHSVIKYIKYTVRSVRLI